MEISASTVRELAARLGHARLEVVRQGQRFALECSCGYRSVGRRTVPLAADAGIHHLQLVVRRFAASGRPWPAPGDTPPAGVVFEAVADPVAS